MTSSALKGQKVEKRRKPKAAGNAGRMLDAANELRTAIETIQQFDAAALTKALLAADKWPANADRIAQIFNASTEYASGRLMTAVDEAVELLAEITGGIEPTEGNMGCRSDRDTAWSKLRQVLELKNWPRNAIDEVIDVGTDMVNDGCYVEVFGYATTCGPGGNCGGCGKCSAPTVSDPAADADGVVICHGCPEQNEPGVELDPRGFPGLLCVDCAEKARADVATGHADLGPNATDEAKKKAAEVEADYRAKTGAGVPS